MHFAGPGQLAAHVFQMHGIDMTQVMSSEPVPEKKRKVPNLVKLTDLRPKEEPRGNNAPIPVSFKRIPIADLFCRTPENGTGRTFLAPLRPLPRCRALLRGPVEPFGSVPNAARRRVQVYLQDLLLPRQRQQASREPCRRSRFRARFLQGPRQDVRSC